MRANAIQRFAAWEWKEIDMPRVLGYATVPALICCTALIMEFPCRNEEQVNRYLSLLFGTLLIFPGASGIVFFVKKRYRERIEKDRRDFLEYCCRDMPPDFDPFSPDGLNLGQQCLNKTLGTLARNLIRAQRATRKNVPRRRLTEEERTEMYRLARAQRCATNAYFFVAQLGERCDFFVRRSHHDYSGVH